MKRIIGCLAVLAIFAATLVFGKTPIDFGNKDSRNWSQDEDTVYITVDEADLQQKKSGASKVWVVLSARYLGLRFWEFYPEFTEKCITGKSYDFKWIEAIQISPSKIASNQFKVTNATGAYYGFILVEKGGALQVVKPKKIGGKSKYLDNELVANPVAVSNPQTLKREWDDDKRPMCK